MIVQIVQVMNQENVTLTNVVNMKNVFNVLVVLVFRKHVNFNDQPHLSPMCQILMVLMSPMSQELMIAKTVMKELISMKENAQQIVQKLPLQMVKQTLVTNVLTTVNTVKIIIHVWNAKKECFQMVLPVLKNAQIEVNMKTRHQFHLNVPIVMKIVQIVMDQINVMNAMLIIIDMEMNVLWTVQMDGLLIMQKMKMFVQNVQQVVHIVIQEIRVMHVNLLQLWMQICKCVLKLVLMELFKKEIHIILIKVQVVKYVNIVQADVKLV